MKSIKLLKPRLLLASVLAAASVGVGGVAVWQALKLPVEASADNKQHLSQASSENRQDLHTRLKRGIGSEVRFASVDKREQVADAVQSANQFIYRRAGFRMSDELKNQLIEAETRALRGNAKLITLDEFTDNLTASVVERLKNITDEEIGQAAEVSADEQGQIMSRADGRWGVLSRYDLIQQAKAGREWSRRGDSALRDTLRSMIDGEVNDRVSSLSAALPEQFGKARTQGLTPTQAFLIAYSVAADDPLTDSQSDIQQLAIQKRIETGQTREQKKAQRISGRPYGPHGTIHPSAAHIFFNSAAVDSLLNLSKGGKNQ